MRAGLRLHRPEVFRFLAGCEPGDVLLVEQVDRLSRLIATDWPRLHSLIDAKKFRIVASGLPISWRLTRPADEFTARMFAAVNAMMLNVLAAVAHKDYEDRRCRRAASTAKAEVGGVYRSRPTDRAWNPASSLLVSDRRSWQEIMDATGNSRTLLRKIRRDRRLLKAEPSSKPGDLVGAAPSLPRQLVVRLRRTQHTSDQGGRAYAPICETVARSGAPNTQTYRSIAGSFWKAN